MRFASEPPRRLKWGVWEATITDHLAEPRTVARFTAGTLEDATHAAQHEANSLNAFEGFVAREPYRDGILKCVFHGCPWQRTLPADTARQHGRDHRAERHRDLTDWRIIDGPRATADHDARYGPSQLKLTA